MGGAISTKITSSIFHVGLGFFQVETTPTGIYETTQTSAFLVEEKIMENLIHFDIAK